MALVCKHKPEYVLIFLSSFFAIQGTFDGFRSVKGSLVQLSEKVLWHNEGGVKCYRIPLITYTAKKSLIAVAEARKYTCGDDGPKFLAIRRSTDQGKSWSPTTFIHDDGPSADGFNLGAVFTDEQTRTVFIMYTTCAHYIGCDVSSVFLTYSINDGIYWTKPLNLSEQVGTMMFAPGPGFGIQKKYPPKAGRLIVCGHSTMEANGVFCLLSDDHGKNWRYGASLKSIPFNMTKKNGDFIPDECQPIELPDGSILINVRNEGNYHCRCRMIMRSYDGGETISYDSVYFDENLPDPIIAASQVIINNVLYFVNPNDYQLRINLTLRWSPDFGKNWTGFFPVWSKFSGYSTLTKIPGYCNDDSCAMLGLLYEKGTKEEYEEISFISFKLVNY